jgi:hypothetical protein
MLKRILLGLGVVGLLVLAVAWSGLKPPHAGRTIDLQERTPVSGQRLNNNPDDFQFAIVSDRTGGHRAQVFARAVEQLNLLQPEFVIGVGDWIEGETDDRARLHREWREFQTYIARLQMPFFYAPGNHDIANPTEEKLWKEKFGRSYYDFVYRNVLFLVLNSEDPPGKNEGSLSAHQLAFLKRSIEAHPSVRWTLVFVHKPMWVFDDGAKNGWRQAEQILNGRPYTVFAGHIHRYQKFVRNGQRYYMLATTGGLSKLRGTGYGEFDHIVWVTMKRDGPILANVMLDGVLSDDLKPIETGETAAVEYHRQPTQPVRGKVFFEGQPVPQAYIVLQAQAQGPRPPRADAISEADGSFTLSTYSANDGAPVGEYAVTVVWRKPFYDATGKPGPNLLPTRYAEPRTTPLKAVIKNGANDLVLVLQKEARPREEQRP